MMFIDSGAHSLYTREVLKKGMTLAFAGTEAKEAGFVYYESDDFWQYVDAYAAFIKEFEDGVDFYVNVDVIFNPKLSWKVQRYLEDTHGLFPVPVIHYGTPLKWFRHYLDHGYEFLGIGGLGQEAKQDMYVKWADEVFSLLCPPPRRLPIVRTHGFAMTAHYLVTRYPWWSVDSASWVKAGAYGGIYVPRKTGDKFDFKKDPFCIGISDLSPARKVKGRHFYGLNKGAAKLIESWLDHIQVPLGSVDENGEMVEWGVVSHYGARAMANLSYYQAMANSVPPWPWPFEVNIRKGFGLA
jgi:hypothetical protein